MGNISVYFKNLDYGGEKSYYHEFIVWTRDDGFQEIIRGGPTGLFGGSGGGSGSSGFGEPGSGDNFPFSEIYVANHPFAEFKKDFLGSLSDPSEVIIYGSDVDLLPYFSRMKTAGAEINALNIPYAAGGPNSNSVVTTLLQAAGLPQPKGNGLDGPYPAPGADMSLLDGKYSARKGYEELLGNAAKRGENDICHTAHNVAGDIARALDEPAIQTVNGSGRTKGPSRPARTGYAKGGAGLTHQTILAIGRGAYLSVAPMAKLRLISARLGEKLRSGGAEPSAVPAALRVPALPPYALAAMRGGAALSGPRHGAVKMMGRHALSLAKHGQFFRPPNVKPANDQRLNDFSPEYARRSGRSNINPWVAPLSKPSQAGNEQKFAPGGTSALGGSGLDVAVKNAIAFQSSRFGAARLMGRTMPSMAPRPYGAGAADYDMMRAGLNLPMPNAPLDRQSIAAATDFWARKNQAGGTLDACPAQTAPAMETPRADRAAIKQAIEEHFALAARLPPAGMTGFDPRLSPAWAGMQLPGG